MKHSLTGGRTVYNEMGARSNLGVRVRKQGSDQVQYTCSAHSFARRTAPPASFLAIVFFAWIALVLLVADLDIRRSLTHLVITLAGLDVILKLPSVFLHSSLSPLVYGVDALVKPTMNWTVPLSKPSELINICRRLSRPPVQDSSSKKQP